MKKAFSLVEILIVIAVIGILAGVVLVYMGGGRQQAKNSKIIAESSSLNDLLKLYYANEGSVPENVSNGAAMFIGNTGTNGKKAGHELIEKGYMSEYPAYSDFISYYDYGSFVTVFSYLEPQKYGPFPAGWNCSADVGLGWWEGMPAPGTLKLYCNGFYK